jgi:hypothetical protein
MLDQRIDLVLFRGELEAREVDILGKDPMIKRPPASGHRITQAAGLLIMPQTK